MFYSVGVGEAPCTSDCMANMFMATVHPESEGATGEIDFEVKIMMMQSVAWETPDFYRTKGRSRGSRVVVRASMGPVSHSSASIVTQ